MENSGNEKLRRVEELITKIKFQMTTLVDESKIEGLLNTLYYLRTPSEFKTIEEIKAQDKEWIPHEVENDFKKMISQLVLAKSIPEVEIGVEKGIDLLEWIRKDEKRPNVIKAPREHKKNETIRGNLSEYNLKKLFQKIQNEGYSDNVLILRLDNSRNYYLQFLAAKNSNMIFCEAVSNFYLTEEHALSKKKQMALINNGWEPPISYEEKSNYYREQNLNMENNWLAFKKLLEWTALEIYNAPISPKTSFTLFLQ